MALRWTAAGMMEAAKGFRRLKACKQLPALRAALAAHHANLVALEDSIQTTPVKPFSTFGGTSPTDFFAPVPNREPGSNNDNRDEDKTGRRLGVLMKFIFHASSSQATEAALV